MNALSPSFSLPSTKLRRREALLGLGGWAVGLLPVAGWAQAADRTGFSARSWADLRAQLGIAPVDSKEIELRVPDVSEDGSKVPVGVSSRLPGTTDIVLVVDRNPFPLVAWFDLPTGTAPQLELGVKMGESSPVRALVKAQGKWHQASKDVRVTLGACGGEAAPSAAEIAATRIRATVREGMADVRALVTHPMENGLRTGADGAAIPAHYVRELSVSSADKVVLRARWGVSVSRNPLLTLRYQPAAAGDTVSVAWSDNRGQQRRDEAKLRSAV